MAVTVEQIGEALSTSVCCLFAQRMYNVDGSAFEQAIATSEDMGDLASTFVKAAGLLETATWREIEETWRSNFAVMEGTAASKGLKIDTLITNAAVETAKKKVAAAYEPLHEAKDVYLVTYSGEYQDITTTWRQMQAEAARTFDTTAEDWMQSYTDTLARKGVGVSIGDSGVRDIAGAVRSYTLESKFAYSDDICREAALSVGMDAAQVSVHGSCAPDHLPYQGHVYKLTELDRINETISRPIGRGVMNCRHTLLYCYADSLSTYSEDELQGFADDSNRTVSYTGRSGKKLTSSWYDATQYVRSSEVNIRKLKQTRYIKNAAGLDTTSITASIEKAEEKYEDLCDELGLRASTERTTAYKVADL